MALISRLKVTLSDIEPQGLRRFDLSLKFTLNRLHDVIRQPWDGWGTNFKSSGRQRQACFFQTLQRLS